MVYLATFFLPRPFLGVFMNHDQKIHAKFKEESGGKWWLERYFKMSFAQLRLAKSAANKKLKKVDVKGKSTKGVWDFINKLK
ncbi:MAG TPA: hypothetical protein DF712_21320 [Balneola sp.]|nr:hypothetical protein [Balneola sp.]